MVLFFEFGRNGAVSIYKWFCFLWNDVVKLIWQKKKEKKKKITHQHVSLSLSNHICKSLGLSFANGMKLQGVKTIFSNVMV